MTRKTFRKTKEKSEKVFSSWNCVKTISIILILQNIG